MQIGYHAAFLTCLFASVVAFIGGRVTSVYLLQNHTSLNDNDLDPSIESSSQSYTTTTTTATTKDNDEEEKDDVVSLGLPPPILPGGKEVPRARYTGMHFSEDQSVYENLYLKDTAERDGIKETCFFTEDKRKHCVIDSTHTNDDLEEEDDDDDEGEADHNATSDDEDEHLPAGQHLLLDIKHVDSSFLDSEYRLAKAMVEVIDESKLTLLSYHCHKMVPMGVTCVGILLESHISFHTWPEAGVISMDLYTCGSGKLVPVVPIIEKLFAIHQEKNTVILNDDDPTELPLIRWSHKFRGFRKDTQWGENGYLASDLGDIILDPLIFDYKKEIAWAKTPFQRVDIYDSIGIDSSYEQYMRSLKNDTSYESLHPQLYRPQRTVFLDGVLQSTRKGMEAYHESLVHPAMFAHAYPERIAIIGGGEGATLREVLKHNTVEVVKMIEIDEIMVQISREHLPEWNDCSDIMGSDAQWCGDDSRAELYYQDAIAWFKERFIHNDTNAQNSCDDEEEGGDDECDDDDDDYDHDAVEPAFDVLIMDALDPQDYIPFAEILYTDETFIQTLYDALSEDGVIVLQLGRAPYIDEPADQFTYSNRRTSLLNLMEKVGFESMHIYEDANCGFNDPWVFLVAMKNSESRKRWFHEAPHLDIDIRKRIHRSKSGKPLLQYFDVGVMSNYLYPNKAFETVFCRTIPTPKSCLADTQFYEKVNDIPTSMLEVGQSTIREGSGRGVFTKVDIQRGSTIAKADARRPVVFTPNSALNVWYFATMSKDIANVFRYMDGYGWQSSLLGPETYIVDRGIITFMNHGCHGSFNVDELGASMVTEQTATEEDGEHFRKVFDPFEDRRNIEEFKFDVSTRDVIAGEELLCNYVFFTDNIPGVDENVWWKELLGLRRMCNGEDLGMITLAEEGKHDGTFERNEFHELYDEF